MTDTTKPKTKPLVSVIIPMLNEAENTPAIYQRLTAVFTALPQYRYEIIFVDDGSTDASVANVQAMEKTNKHVRLIRLARNFGKEIATTAGLHQAKGQAAIMIDADLQHPPEVIPQFLEQWEAGFDVVVGKRADTVRHASFFKRISSRGFYRLMNAMSSIEIDPSATDFRLLDRTVIDEYNRFTERKRMTRGLIDWLGFSRTYVPFEPALRLHGKASYSYRHLIRLATDSIISLSFFPLRIAGYLGVFITTISAPLGIFIIANKYFFDNSLKFSGPAMLAVMLLFLVGVVLISQGLTALYIANIYSEVINRPLYVERRRRTR